jgi:hypothetical protein
LSTVVFAPYLCSGKEEWKILESRTEKDGTFERTLGKEEVTGEVARQKEKERVAERGEVAKTSVCVTLADKCPVWFRRSKNLLHEVYVPLQDACSFNKVAKIWAATSDRNL